MVSYIKTQWLNLLLCFINVGFSIYNLAQDNEFWSALWFISAITWFIISRVDYNHDRITLLEKKAKKYDALAEEVKALVELVETERKYSDHLNRRIDSLVKTVEDLKHGN